MRLRARGELTDLVGATPRFYDDFSSGDLSHDEGGVQWGSANIGSGDGAIAVVAGAGYGGSNALRFRFNAGAFDRLVEQRMYLDSGIFTSEFWTRFDYWCPANRFYSQTSSGSPNDKFFALWGGEYNPPAGPTTPGFTLNAWPFDNGSGQSGVTCNFFNRDWGGHAWNSYGSNFLTTADYGRWRRVVMAWILPANSSAYGRFGYWMDNGVTGSYTKLVDVDSNDVTIDEVPQGSNFVTGQSSLSEAYWFGARNSYVTEQEDHLISRVAIHTSNIFGVAW